MAGRPTQTHTDLFHRKDAEYAEVVLSLSPDFTYTPNALVPKAFGVEPKPHPSGLLGAGPPGALPYLSNLPLALRTSPRREHTKLKMKLYRPSHWQPNGSHEPVQRSQVQRLDADEGSALCESRLVGASLWNRRRQSCREGSRRPS
jgi:hypothetical protein